MMFRVNRFNLWLARKVVSFLGSMWCAYIFMALAAVGFPRSAFHTVHDAATFMAWLQQSLTPWLSQTFIQLVALSILQVGSKLIERLIIDTHNLAVQEHKTTREMLRRMKCSQCDGQPTL